MPANCCTKTHYLGCIECGNQDITLPVNAAMEGTYRALFAYLGRTIVFTFTGTTGEPLVIPSSGLNERFVYSFHVEDPNGDRVSFGAFDCFSIRTIPCVIDGDEHDGDDCDLTINGVDVSDTMEVVDQDGNQIGSLVAGKWVVNTTGGMEYIAETYATEADALLDEDTVPDVKQAILVAGRLYQGNGSSNAKQLVEAKQYNPTVTETGKGLNVDLIGVTAGIQLTDPT